ncbi:hypothetical protein QBC42DRAFT_333156 [Cladorrhinum samala]|uniref:Cytochrome b561 domain-containing protein n=1 Tax=Cladorrhinum samala TaxID=585594 RepID=A0AAV9I223_9PEZI|nr:hypothetical protein QBC42DRAFT_333156 [Cladorrhinum samala]
MPPKLHSNLLRITAITLLLPILTLARNPGSSQEGHWPWSGSSDGSSSSSSSYSDHFGSNSNSHPGSGNSASGNPNGGNGGGASGFDSGFNRGNGGGGGPGFDVQAASHYRTIHGILAAVSMVILFPVGSVLLRVLPGKLGVWVHALFQVLAACVYVAGVGLGIYLVTVVRIPGRSGSLLTDPSINYHPIIGLVLLGLFLIQPVIGLIHHARFKKLQRRQVWSYLHLLNGRAGITVGIVNGGLGLNLAGASAHKKKVYVIVASVIWVLWMVVAIVAELIKFRQKRTRAAEEAKMVKAASVGRRGSD